jgi:glycogen debranching enzyme
MIHFMDKAIHGVEQKLWSEEGGCYIDLQYSESAEGKPYRLLTQDVSLYLIAVSQNTTNDSLSIHSRRHYDNKGQQQQEPKVIHEDLYNRAISTLDAMRRRTWKEKWPLVTEKKLKRTGPWILKPYQYHNHTFWPWTTGIEILARSRFNEVEGCDILFSKLASEDHPHIHAFYEWINPITDQGFGAYPFRTGISAVRIALADILEKMKK